MTFPSFTTGEVLTAADMNAVGLWLVKTQTIGSAVATQAVTGAFSTDYDNYLVTVSGGAGSTADAVLTLQLGSTTAGYYYSLLYAAYNTTPLAAGAANAANWVYCGISNVNGISMAATICAPFLSKGTMISASVGNRTAYGGQMNGYLNNTTSYTGFTIGVSAGTMTGGTIRVYGMRN
jgi:hypothetical protein